MQREGVFREMKLRRSYEKPSERKAREKAEAVRRAADRGSNLVIAGNGTRSFLGRRALQGDRLELSGLDGLVSYEPDELIVVARPGMRLTALEQLLAERGQHLAFEPPHWSGAATLGGAIACGLSGPRRFKAGSGSCRATSSTPAATAPQPASPGKRCSPVRSFRLRPAFGFG